MDGTHIPVFRIFRSMAMVLALAASIVVSAQTPQPSPAAPADVRAVGVSMLHLNVVNLDQSLAFYHDVLGMELIAPATPARPNTGLVNEPGALIRTVQLCTPNKAFQMELVEWSGIALKPVQPRIQDPARSCSASTCATWTRSSRARRSSVCACCRGTVSRI